MGFVIGVVVALIVVFLLAYITIRKPVFGEIIIALSVLMIAAVIFFYFQKDNRVENKKNLIPIAQIELSDFAHSLAYGHYHKITAHLKNQSQRYRLQSIILNISFFQCPQSFNSVSDDLMSDDKLKKCHLLTEKQHKIDTRMAARQAGQIESYILLDDDVLLKTSFLHWKIQIINGVAR